MLQACLRKSLRSGIHQTSLYGTYAPTSISAQYHNQYAGRRKARRERAMLLNLNPAAATVVAMGSQTAGASTHSRNHSSQSATWNTCRGLPKRKEDRLANR